MSTALKLNTCPCGNPSTHYGPMGNACPKCYGLAEHHRRGAADQAAEAEAIRRMRFAPRLAEELRVADIEDAAENEVAERIADEIVAKTKTHRAALVGTTDPILRGKVAAAVYWRRRRVVIEKLNAAKREVKAKWDLIREIETEAAALRTKLEAMSLEASQLDLAIARAKRNP